MSQQALGKALPHPNPMAQGKAHVLLRWGNWDVSDATKISGHYNLASTENTPKLQYCTSTSNEHVTR